MEYPPIQQYEIYGVKAPAALSILGSTAIVLEVVADMRQSKSNAISRTLFSMSIGDLLYSISWALSTWVAPHHLTYLHDTNYGTNGTCAAQGFLTELGGGAALFFNTFLALLYLLLVKYNWSDPRMAGLERKMQPFFWLLALVLAIIPIPLEMYNNAGAICYIESYPLGCTQSWMLEEEEEQVDNDDDNAEVCTRGDNSLWYQISMGILPIWICTITVGVIMCIIWRMTRSVEENNLRYSVGPSTTRAYNSRNAPQEQEPEPNTNANFVTRSSRYLVRQSSQLTLQRRTSTTTLGDPFKTSKLVARQGLWYMLGFILTYALYTVFMVILLVSGTWHYDLGAVSGLFLAGQGIWNFIIYSRKRNMQTQLGKGLRWCIWGLILKSRGSSMQSLVSRAVPSSVRFPGGRNTRASIASSSENHKASAAAPTAEEEEGRIAARSCSALTTSDCWSVDKDSDEEDVGDDTAPKTDLSKDATAIVLPPEVALYVDAIVGVGANTVNEETDINDEDSSSAIDEVVDEEADPENQADTALKAEEDVDMV